MIALRSGVCEYLAPSTHPYGDMQIFSAFFGTYSDLPLGCAASLDRALRLNYALLSCLDRPFDYQPQVSYLNYIGASLDTSRVYARRCRGAHRLRGRPCRAPRHLAMAPLQHGAHDPRLYRPWRQTELGIGYSSYCCGVPPNGSTPVWFAGAVNGGVWRTKDGMQAAQPHWTPVTDYPQPVRCQSIGALTTGAEAGIPHLVVAGCGSSTSSMMGVDWNMADTGDYGGVIISTDYGETWAMAANFPMNANVGALSVLPGAARGEFVLLVAVRSFYFDRDEGGIWRATIDFRRHDAALTTIFERVFDKPVYAIAAHSGIALAALPFTTDSSVVRSDDAGANWASFASGIDWGGGRVPFYPALSMTASTAFVGALTVRPLPGNERLQTNTSGAIFYRDLRSKAESAWQAVANTPRLDDDSMPKDRMALLADPTDPSLLYVAGNGIYTASRVRFATGEWFDLKGPDGSEPHSDMRNFAWDPLGDRLVIVTDGGVSVRDSPHTSARWRSANGDMKTMEMLAASYDPVDDRWIACAQDSCMPAGRPPSGPSRHGRRRRRHGHGG